MSRVEILEQPAEDCGQGCGKVAEVGIDRDPEGWAFTYCTDCLVALIRRGDVLTEAVTELGGKLP